MKWLVLALLAGCTEQPPACITTIDLNCQPEYLPTFANVYNNTLENTCGSQRSTCHSDSGMKGGMSFATPEQAYTALLMNGRVMPGDPQCSDMIVRTSSPGKDYQMPIGDPLSAPEACALIQWVKAGAPGPIDAGVD